MLLAEAGRARGRRRLGGAAPRRRPPARPAALARRAARRRSAGRLRRFARLVAGERLRAERLPGRAAARARDRGDGLRPRDPRPLGRRPAAGEPAQADAAGARVRARRGPRPARLPRLRRAAGPGRGARGRGGARVRGARRRAAHDDPPREGAGVPGRLRGRPRPHGRGRPRAAADRAPTARGLKLATLAGGDPVPALGWEAIAEELAVAESAEERRLLYVAATRAEERLILSGGVDTARWPAPRPGRAAARLARAGAAGRPRRGARPTRGPRGRRSDAAVPGARAPPPPDPPAWPARGRAGRHGRRAAARAVVARLVTAATLPPAAAAPAPRDRTTAPGTALPAEPKVIPSGGRPQPSQRGCRTRRCRTTRAARYRFYLGPRARPAARRGAAARPRRAARARSPRRSRPAIRGSLVHALLEELDFARPGAARRATAVRALAAAFGLELAPRPGGGRPRPGRGVRRLAAVRAARRRPRRPARGRLRLRARARRRRAARPRASSTCSPARPTARRSSSTTRPTGSTSEDTPAALIERAYAIQRKVYALAALQEGAERVEVAYALTERPGEPVSATFTRRTSPRWPTRCAARRPACSPRRGRSPSTRTASCAASAPAARTLCSWPETMTLRPPEEAYAASAGTLAGSGGPS